MSDAAHSILPVPWRRALLFLCGIAGPVLIGLWMGNSDAALPAGVTGLLLCWAESAGSLVQRLRALAIVAGAMVLGTLLGFLAVRAGPWILWPLALFGGCGAGWAATKQGLWPLTTRDAAIAFAIGTLLPPPTITHGGILAAGLALIVVSRMLDHALNGPLPMLPAARSLDKPKDRASRLRFALAYGVAATVALALGWYLSPDYAPWVIITTLVVMQPDASASYLRVALRIAGALLAWRVHGSRWRWSAPPWR